MELSTGHTIAVQRSHVMQSCVCSDCGKSRAGQVEKGADRRKVFLLPVRTTHSLSLHVLTHMRILTRVSDLHSEESKLLQRLRFGLVLTTRHNSRSDNKQQPQSAIKIHESSVCML